MSPFDEARYARLLAGLEAVEVFRSSLNEDIRIDAQYFRKRYLYEDACRRHFESVSLGSQAFITDGPHGYHEVDVCSPIAMLTARCAKEWFADRTVADTISTKTDESNRRSSLKVDDLILSTRGTVGACAIVELQSLPANIDQDVARIALQADAQIDSRYLLAYLNSTFGQDWIERNSTGMVQQGLSLAKVRELPILVLSAHFQGKIDETITVASKLRRNAEDSLSNADSLLLNALGLDGWNPPDPLTYIRSSRDAFNAGRLDAEFFTPRVRDMLARLGRDDLTIQDVAPTRKERFTPADSGDFHYIEIGGLATDGTAQAERLFQREAPSRATQYVRAGDVITSTVRPIRRLSAAIDESQDGYVCSSGFVVLQPSAIYSDVLLTYLRLPPICVLMDLHTSASMYPAISESDLLALPIPKISTATQQAVEKSVLAARQAKQRASKLLDAAKRAVEIAIEQDEKSALTYLEAQV